MIDCSKIHIRDNYIIGVVDKGVFSVFMFATMVWCPPVNDNIPWFPEAA